MRSRLATWASLGLALLWAVSGRAGPEAAALEPIAGELDPTVLVQLMSQGELCLVASQPNGRLKQATVLGLVEAPPEQVWATITDYESYPRFMPSVVEAQVIKREGTEVVVTYELEVPGSNLEYTLRHQHQPIERIDIRLADDEGDIQTGAWRWVLMPYAAGKQTILIYHLYTDVRESSWFVRQALESQPAMEHGLHIATGLFTVRAVKKRVMRTIR